MCPDMVEQVECELNVGVSKANDRLSHPTPTRSPDRATLPLNPPVSTAQPATVPTLHGQVSWPSTEEPFQAVEAANIHLKCSAGVYDDLAAASVPSAVASEKSPLSSGKAKAECTPKSSLVEDRPPCQQAHRTPPAPGGDALSIGGNGSALYRDPRSHSKRYEATPASSPASNSRGPYDKSELEPSFDNALPDVLNLNAHASNCREQSCAASPASSFQPRRQASPSVPASVSPASGDVPFRPKALYFTIPTTVPCHPQPQIDVLSEDESRCCIGSVMDISVDPDEPDGSMDSSATGKRRPKTGLWVPGPSLPKALPNKAMVNAATVRLATLRPHVANIGNRPGGGSGPRTPLNIRALRRDLADEMQVFSKQSLRGPAREKPRPRGRLSKENKQSVYTGHLR